MLEMGGGCRRRAGRRASLLHGGPPDSSFSVNPSEDSNPKSTTPRARPVWASRSRRGWALWRPRLLRVLLAVLVPTLLFGSIEVALRISGYGHPTSFLLPARIGDRDMRVDNPRFGWRFFPSRIARSPVATAFTAKKDPGVYRIFLFGESAALGDPRPSLGVAPHLEVLLEDRFPGTRFEVIPAAMTAINSHVMREIADEVARYDGDLWIVYAGNNEYSGPFFPNTAFGGGVVHQELVRWRMRARATRLGQWLTQLMENAQSRGKPTEWAGLKAFRDSELSPSDPRRRVVEEAFRRNVEEVVRTAGRAGVPVVLSTMATNLRDCAPFGTWRAGGMSSNDVARAVAAFRAAPTNTGPGGDTAAGWREAAKACRLLLEADPRDAETHFRLGVCELALGNATAARTEFLMARDLDALPFRADSDLNLAVTTIAEDMKGRRLGFVDAQKAIAEVSDFGIAGGDLFYEHVHLNPEGNQRLAVALADAVIPWLPKAIAEKGRSAWPDAATCAEQLGLSDWNRYAMLEDIARRLNEAPYTSQFNHGAQRRRIAEQMSELRQRLHPREVADARERFEAAVKRRPDRAWIHQNFAEFLEMAGDTEAALAEWRSLAKLLPHHYQAPYQSARLLARLKRFDEAREQFEAALRIRPDLDEARLDLGQIHAAQKKWDEALREYAVFQARRPDDPRVLVRKADVLAARGQRPEAVQCLREAVALRPTYWEARYLLGVELGVDGKFAEAEPEFREVVRLNPEHTLARFNWAVSLAKQSRYADAIREFEEVLRRNPGNTQARQYLNALKASATVPAAK
ncbi:MAG: hypothetical protein RLZ45_1239 [Verrucomicrobiota bacterium]